MATKTAEELGDSMLGELGKLDPATVLTMYPIDATVRVRFPFTTDTGDHASIKAVTLKPAELAAGLTVEQRNALLDLVASKI